MKNKTHIKTFIIKNLFIILIFIGASSCLSDPKAKDTKEIAQDNNEANYDNTSKEKDALFLVYAAETCLKEIQLGQLAQQRSKMEEVKKLGKMMEDNHKIFLEELTALTTKKSIAIPKSLTDESQVAYKKLTNVMDVDFDKEYCNMMVTEHKLNIIEFGKGSVELKDREIKNWAAAKIATLNMHLDHSMICQEICDNKK